MEIMIYKLPNYVYNCYKKKVKNAKELDYETVQKILSRNIHLGKWLLDGEIQSLILFDDMLIKIKKDTNTIVGLWTDREPDDTWELHRKKFNKINKYLGIPMEV